VILAGDIYAPGASGVTWAANAFPNSKVLIVPGNHEFYDRHYGLTLVAMHNTASMFDNVWILDSTTLIIDGVAFIGATLWTDFNLYGVENQEKAMLAGLRGMNDFHVITHTRDAVPLTPEHTLMFHNEQREFIREALVQAEGKKVVITHHAPSIQSVPERYRTHPLTPCFASNVEALVEKADLWIHGHTHDSFDYQLGKCRVICNPRGYPVYGHKPENPNFNPHLIVEI
jgi:predicted phosphodiesterase